jgi:hypothetical protein
MDDVSIGEDVEIETRQQSSRRLQVEAVQLGFVPRGLDRIDQVSLPLDGQYKHRLDGSGVTVYILDSGLRLSHVEFKNRTVSCGFDAFASCQLKTTPQRSRRHALTALATVPMWLGLLGEVFRVWQRMQRWCQCACSVPTALAVWHRY